MNKDIITRLKENSYMDSAGHQIWLKSCDSYGYGEVYFKEKVRKVHRVSAYLYLGLDINGPLFVLHKCDRRDCFNPDHLYIGTHQDNMRDAAKAGSLGSAERNKTHCPQGHPYNEENTRVYSGKRHCRPCYIENRKRLRTKNAELRARLWESKCKTDGSR